MPATDYSKTVIYVIKCRDDNITEEYVGSTTNFRSRKWEHKSCCNNEKSKQYNDKKYQVIRANGGWENWIMIQLEEYPCKNKREAECREDQVRLERKALLNVRRPFITEEEKKENRKKKDEENKDKIKEQNKKWAQENREKRYEYQKQRYAEKKDEISEKRKLWYQKNKEKMNERGRQRYAEKKDEINEKSKLWYQKNKEKINERDRQRYAEKKDIMFGLKPLV